MHHGVPPDLEYLIWGHLHGKFGTVEPRFERQSRTSATTQPLKRDGAFTMPTVDPQLEALEAGHMSQSSPDCDQHTFDDVRVVVPDTNRGL